MCDNYSPRKFVNKPKRANELSLLLLDCWQREYDKRPYSNFQFKRTEFEERMQRYYHPVKDFSQIVEFLQRRALLTIFMSGVTVVGIDAGVLQEFTYSLEKMRRIELRLMDLPRKFFMLLRKNVDYMHVNELILEGTRLLNKDVQQLSMFIIKSKTLKYLNVGHCSLTQYNFSRLADSMHKSRTLKGFSCNRLVGRTLMVDTTKIAYTISSLIWQNKLETIEMQQCEFVAYDMEILSEYMNKKNSKLLKLNLAYNIIAADGAETLFRAIVNSGTLTHLNIAGNGLGSHGGDVVAKYLSSCYYLEYLNIMNNEIGAEPISNILAAMKKSVKLTKLLMYGNRFDGRCAMILRRLLDARVVLQEWIDISSTFDKATCEYRIIPWL